MKYTKNPHMGQMGNSGLFVAHNYASLYLRICFKDSFKLYSMIGHSKQIKFTQVKFLKKLFLGQSFSTLESIAPLVL